MSACGTRSRDALRHGGSLSRRLPVLGLLAVLGLGTPLRAPAQAGDEAPPGIGLGRAVPSDALLYLRYRVQPESPLSAVMKRVGDVLERRQIPRRLFSRALERALGAEASEGTARRQFERLRDRWLELLGSVEWSTLLSKEVALAARIDRVPEGLEDLSGDAPAPDRLGPRQLLLLFRVEPESRERVAEGLKRVLYALCAISPVFEITESWTREEQIVILHDVSQAEALTLGARDDVILLSTSTNLLRRSLQLLSGRGSDLGFEFTARRADELEAIGFSRDRLSGGGVELHVSVRELLPEIPALAGVQHLSFACEPTGEKIRYGYRFRFEPAELPGASLARRAFLERPRLRNWKQQVPEGVDSFQISSGVTPGSCLEFTTGLLAAFLPSEASDLLPAELRAAPLDLLTGRRVLLEEGGRVALLLEVRNADRAREAFEAMLPGIEARLAARDIRLEPEEAGKAGGRLCRVAPPSGSSPLCFGIIGEHLVLASSADFVRRVARDPSSTGSGELPDLPGELPVPSGELQSVTFSEPPPALLVFRLGLEILRAFSRNPPPGAENLSGAGLGEIILELAPVITALESLGRDSSAAVRVGDSLRGVGRLDPQRERKPPRERRL